MKDSERIYELKIEILNKKVANQQREIAVLSKSAKRGPAAKGEKRETREQELKNSRDTRESTPKSQDDESNSGFHTPITKQEARKTDSRNSNRDSPDRRSNSIERNSDRNSDKNSDKNSDRNSDRNSDKNSDRNSDKNSDKNSDRDSSSSSDNDD